MSNTKIVPSLLSADFSCLEKEIRKVEKTGCDRIQLDVMDGKFVDNITFGPVLIRSIRKVTDLFFEAHLMIDRPERYLEDFKTAGADCLLIHREACCDYGGTIKKVKDLGIEAGVVIKPGTPVESIQDVLEHIDMVLVMTVEPGFGGQSFIGGIEEKIKAMKDYLLEKEVDIPVEVDGGVNPDTIPGIVEAGASLLVAGSAVFGGDVGKNIERLRSAIPLR